MLLFCAMASMTAQTGMKTVTKILPWLGTVYIGCIAMLLPQMGIPMEAISLILGLYPFAGAILCMINSTGDAVITTVVAARSGQLDNKVFDE